MLVSVNWLKELLKLDDIDTKSLANKMSSAGLEVEDEAASLQGAMDVLRTRLDTAGYTEATITKQGNDQIVVIHMLCKKRLLLNGHISSGFVKVHKID